MLAKRDMKPTDIQSPRHQRCAEHAQAQCYPFWLHSSYGIFYSCCMFYLIEKGVVDSNYQEETVIR